MTRWEYIVAAGHAPREHFCLALRRFVSRAVTSMGSGHSTWCLPSRSHHEFRRKATQCWGAPWVRSLGVVVSSQAGQCWEERAMLHNCLTSTDSTFGTQIQIQGTNGNTQHIATHCNTWQHKVTHGNRGPKTNSLASIKTVLPRQEAIHQGPPQGGRD